MHFPPHGSRVQPGPVTKTSRLLKQMRDMCKTRNTKVEILHFDLESRVVVEPTINTG